MNRDDFVKARWSLFDELELKELQFGLQMSVDQDANTTESDMLLEEINAELKHREWIRRMERCED